MESYGLLICSQQHATGSYPQLDEFSPHPIRFDHSNKLLIIIYFLNYPFTKFEVNIIPILGAWGGIVVKAMR
jgi:hypothetical protein